MSVLPRYVDELNSECTREPLHVLEHWFLNMRLVFQDNHLSNRIRVGNLERRKSVRRLQKLSKRQLMKAWARIFP